MRQNAVASRPPQRNELISHAFSGPFLFISEKLMPGWSRSIPSKANARRLRRDYKVFQSQWCFRSERAFFGLVENRLLFRTPNGTSGKVDRALGTIANDANPGVSQVKTRSARRYQLSTSMFCKESQSVATNVQNQKILCQPKHPHTARSRKCLMPRVSSTCQSRSCPKPNIANC